MRLSDGHLARIPHGAVLSQQPSLPHTPVYQYRDVDIPILKLNSYVRLIDGETILEYVPPQEHILMLKQLLQYKNSCSV